MIKRDKEYLLREERGKRAKLIREKLIVMPRSQFAKKYHVSLSTVQAWEDADLGGMSESGAQRLITIYQQNNLNVELEWLMYGKGAGPFTNDEQALQNQIMTVDEVIHQEVKLFYQLNKNAVHTIVKDDALAPWLTPGDYVAGQWNFERVSANINNFPGIVQLETGELLIRVIETATGSHHVNLTCTNPQTTVHEPVMKNIKVVSVAPIIWIRKKQLARIYP